MRKLKRSKLCSDKFHTYVCRSMLEEGSAEEETRFNMDREGPTYLT